MNGFFAKYCSVFAKKFRGSRTPPEQKRAADFSRSKKSVYGIRFAHGDVRCALKERTNARAPACPSQRVTGYNRLQKQMLPGRV